MSRKLSWFESKRRHQFQDDYSKQLLPPNFRQAVQLGTVVEIGVRFPATPHHPVFYAFIAQLVEQRIENPCVTGSNPVRGTSFRIVTANFNELDF